MAFFTSGLKFRPSYADYLSVVTAEEYEQREIQLNRFKRLIGELLRGQTARNAFAPWEIELLMDFDACELPSRRRVEIIRQYQRAVERQMQSGVGPPMKLSQFLVIRERRRTGIT
ncbi:MAG: hypothetical protein ABI806_01210 [Candidatus Solibacter sp.]